MIRPLLAHTLCFSFLEGLHEVGADDGEAAEEGEAAVKGGSLTAFEKACDNAVLKTAAGARQVPFGVEVALGYLIAKEAEWTAVRIVMAGRLAGLSADAIRERLRDAYV